MTIPIFQFTAVDRRGNIVGGAQVEVRKESDGLIATIYSDPAGAVPLANPFTADADGFAFFHAAIGEYKITTRGGGAFRTWRYVALGGAGGGTSGGTQAFDDGTVLLPSITNLGDTDTGFWFPNANEIGVTTGGVEALRVDGTGNIVLPKTTNINKRGIIYKDTVPFLHDFNYGNNGVVTTDGLNTFCGWLSGNFTMGAGATLTPHGSLNSGFGYATLGKVTNGHHNAGGGCLALSELTTGDGNSAWGVSALLSLTTASNCSGFGFKAGWHITTGGGNSCFGVSAGEVLTTGFDNSIFGKGAAFAAIDAYRNSIVGTEAWVLGNGLQNIVIGAFAAPNMTTSNNSVIVGTFTGGGIVTGHGNVVIGPNVVGLAAGLTNTIILANGDGTIRFWNDATGTGLGTTAPDALLSVNGIASFGDGAAATPSIANFGDLNTGFWFPAADTLAASTGGTERVRVASDGKVGIGTSAADALLSVNGVASFGSGAAALPSIARFGDLDTGMWFPAANAIGWSTGGTERMRINADESFSYGFAGNNSGFSQFGIRNTGDGTSGTLREAMSIAQTLRTVGTPLNNANGYIRFFDPAIGSFFAFGCQEFAPYGRRVEFAHGIGADITFTSGALETIRFTTSRNVGVNTTAPDAKFTVNGVSSFAAGAAALPSLAGFGDLDTGFWWPAANVLAGSTAGTERFRILSDGKFGIGTTAPDALFSVNGVASFGAGTAALPSLAQFGDLNTGRWAPAADTLAWSTGGVERMRLTSTGLGIGGTAADLLDVAGTARMDALRIDATPTAAAAQAVTHKLAFNANGTTYYLLLSNV